MDRPVSYCYPELSLSRRTHVRRGIFYSNNNNIRWENRRSTSLIPPPFAVSLRPCIYSFRSLSFGRVTSHSNKQVRRLVTQIITFLEKKEHNFSPVRLIWKTIGQRKKKLQWSRVTSEKQNVPDGQITKVWKISNTHE